ncbi:MAG: hypothetical protein FJX35_02710 [Alphaproteobacteria bacterium]|nr:hypothetical protein [Alphaproteobacteria bacterium]
MRPYTRNTKGKRRDLRVKNDAVLIDLLGKTFAVFDWSLGGIAVDRCDTPCAIGEKLEAVLHRRGDERTFPVQITVTRFDKSRQVMAGFYSDLPGDSFSFLEKLQLHRQ